MGITYVILLIAFVIGYNLPQKSFIAIPALGGVIATVIVLPFVTIAGSLFIVYALKSKNTLIGYLILAIGSYILVYGAVFAVEKMSDHVRIRRRSEERQKQNDYINNTIAQVIKISYPSAQFEMDRDTVVVNLGDYSYQDQPDFNDEIQKWKEIRQDSVFDGFPYGIRIEYYFKNTKSNFASIHLDDFSMYYYPLGMSKEGLELLTPILHEYIGKRHINFEIDSDYSFIITIYKVLQSNEEPAEAEFWQEFIKINNINIELVEIKVAYRNPEKTSFARYYEVRQDRWYGESK